MNKNNINLECVMANLSNELILEFANDYCLSYEEAKIGLAEWILFDLKYYTNSRNSCESKLKELKGEM